MKKLITAAAALAIATLALAACGSTSTTENADASTSPPSAISSEASTAMSTPGTSTESTTSMPTTTKATPSATQASTRIKDFAAATVPDLAELRTTQLEPPCTDDCGARLFMATGFLIGFENDMKAYGLTETSLPAPVAEAYGNWRDDIMDVDLGDCEIYLSGSATAPLCSMDVLGISWATKSLELRLETASLQVAA